MDFQGLEDHLFMVERAFQFHVRDKGGNGEGDALEAFAGDQPNPFSADLQGCEGIEQIIDLEKLQILFNTPNGGRPVLTFAYKLVVLEMWLRLVFKSQQARNNINRLSKESKRAWAQYNQMILKEKTF